MMVATTLLVGDSAHGTTVNAQNGFQSLTHTVTVRPLTDVDTALPAITAASDLIVVVRPLLANVTADTVRYKALLGAGKPLILSSLAAGDTAQDGGSGYTGSAVIGAKLAASYSYRSSLSYSGEAIVPATLHANLASLPLRRGQDRYPLLSRVDPVTTINQSPAAFGVYLSGAVGHPVLLDRFNGLSGDPGLTAIMPGTANLDATATATARTVVSAWFNLYGTGGVLLPEALTYIVEWLLAAPAAASPDKGQIFPRGK
jgi:hypothetical protein